jgi:hypothetical protein
MQQAKIIFGSYFYFCKAMFGKTILAQKNYLTKSCPNKQCLKYLTQNKTKRVDLKTLVQP